MGHIPTVEDVLSAFPLAHPRTIQCEAIDFVVDNGFDALCEIPTGEGKTALLIALGRAWIRSGRSPVFYLVPSKTLVTQIQRDFAGDVQVVLGRSEYECLYYTDHGKKVDAAQSPCYMLRCKHRVNQETGEVEEPDASPCPYFQAKYDAREFALSGKIIVTTMAFFLMNRFSVPSWRDMDMKNALVLMDEVHDIAEVARDLFEYRMTHDHLWKVGDILIELGSKQADKVHDLARTITRIAKSRRAEHPELLKDEEIGQLIAALEHVDAEVIESRLREAIEATNLDPVADRGTIKIIENILRGIPRFLRSLRYALRNEETDRNPLNYVVAFRYDEESVDETSPKAQTWVAIKSYFVVPLIRRACDSRVVGVSATIGQAEIFGHESGLRMPFRSFGSSFDPKKTRIFVPRDTPDLSVRRMRNGDLRLAMVMTAHAVHAMRQAGHRSLIVTVSDAERQKMKKAFEKQGLEVMTYGSDIKPKEAATRFKDGKGDVLLGTDANYGQGVDLPNGTAPFIMVLKPGWQLPDDPMTQFEERRFPQSHCWRLWTYRVMKTALQVRGRNIRSGDDRGVTIFISRQFRRFVFRSLPEALKESYDESKTLEECVAAAIALLAA